MVKIDVNNNGALDFESLGLPENYTFLLTELEKLTQTREKNDRIFGGIDEDANRGVMTEAEYSRFVSDVWIGVVLTLLILSVVFFICSCFLYHKFQQWKNSCRESHVTRPEGIHRFDIEVESLPSYTIVSGLPTYDDALEQFRNCQKSGIIYHSPSVIKVFDETNKKIVDSAEIADNTSINSCSCNTPSQTTVSSVIELGPDQMQILSQKRLSLQIAFNSNIRRSSRGRIDLCREVNRSNLLKSHDLPQLHRSASSLTNPEADSSIPKKLSFHPHRGSVS